MLLVAGFKKQTLSFRGFHAQIVIIMSLEKTIVVLLNVNTSRFFFDQKQHGAEYEPGDTIWVDVSDGSISISYTHGSIANPDSPIT